MKEVVENVRKRFWSDVGDEIGKSWKSCEKFAKELGIVVSL